MNYTLNQVKAQINQAINRVVPVNTQGGKAGQLVWVQIPGVGRIQCKCVADIKQGQAIALLSEQGNWWLAGEIANQEKITTRYKEYRQTELTKVRRQEELSVFFLLEERYNIDSLPSYPPGYNNQINLGSSIAKQYRFAVLWVAVEGELILGYYQQDGSFVEESFSLSGSLDSQVTSIYITGKKVVFWRFVGTIIDFERQSIEVRRTEIDFWNYFLSDGDNYQLLDLTESYPAFLSQIFYCFRERLFYLILTLQAEYTITEEPPYIILTGGGEQVLYKVSKSFASSVSPIPEEFCDFSRDNLCYYNDNGSPLFGVISPFLVAPVFSNYRFRGKSEKVEITNLEEVRTSLSNGETSEIRYTIYSLSNNGSICTSRTLTSGTKRIAFSQEIIDLVNDYDLIIHPFLYL